MMENLLSRMNRRPVVIHGIKIFFGCFNFVEFIFVSHTRPLLLLLLAFSPYQMETSIVLFPFSLFYFSLWCETALRFFLLSTHIIFIILAVTCILLLLCPFEGKKSVMFTFIAYITAFGFKMSGVLYKEQKAIEQGDKYFYSAKKKGVQKTVVFIEDDLLSTRVQYMILTTTTIRTSLNAWVWIYLFFSDDFNKG